MTKTTFVIGAGASVDFGMPTGDELIGVISELCLDCANQDFRTNDADQVEQIEAFESAVQNTFANSRDNIKSSVVAADYLTKIGRSLWLSQSIDTYLNEQDEVLLSDIGKLAIIASILFHEKIRHSKPSNTEDSEDLNPLFEPEPRKFREMNFSSLRKTWLVSFFRALRGQIHFEQLEERLKNTSLVIFNYDRCVEHFLFHAFKTFDNLTDARTTALLGNLKIVHPYGKIARLPWQTGSNAQSVEFGDVQNTHIALNNVGTIRTFMESHRAKTVESIQNSIKQSNCLVFFGFGYAQQNLEMLGIRTDLVHSNSFKRSIFATGYGLSDYKINRTKNILAKFVSGDPRSPIQTSHNQPGNVVLDNCDCTALINEYSDRWF